MGFEPKGASNGAGWSKRRLSVILGDQPPPKGTPDSHAVSTLDAPYQQRFA